VIKHRSAQRWIKNGGTGLRVWMISSLAALLVSLASVEAATWRWDTSSAASYQAGNGVWETDVFWTLNGTALTNWPGVADDSVLNVAAGNSIITIAATVSVFGLQMADQNGRSLTVTGGLLNLGAGGLYTLGTGTQVIESAVALTADQTWRAVSSASVQSPVNGQVSGPFSIAIAGDTFRALRMFNTNNTYSGGSIVNSDGILSAASAGGGVPFGTGPLTIMSRGQAWIRPEGSGSDVSFSVASGVGSRVFINGLSRMYLNRELQNSVSLTLGNAADSNPIFVRTNRSAVSLMGGTGTPPTLGNTGLHNLFVAGGSARVPMHNGVVAPYILNGQYQGGGAGRLLSYTDASGFTNVVYDLTNTFSGADSSKKITFGSAGTVDLLASTSAYAIDISGTTRITLGDGVTLHVGDDAAGFSPLFLNGNSITAAVGAAGASLDFGSNEAVIHQNNNTTAKIGVPISGSNGVTFVSSYNGALTLSENNTYLGPTAVHGMTLTVGEGGTTGSLGASTNIYMGLPAILRFNRSDLYPLSGMIAGDGTVRHVGSGTLAVTAKQGEGSQVILNNNGVGTMEVTMTGNNALYQILTDGTGTTILRGDTNATNTLTASSALPGGGTNGTLKVLSGTWVLPLGLSGGGNPHWRGEILISNATIIASSGQSMRGHTVIENGGFMEIGDRIFLGQAGGLQDNPSITIQPGGRLVLTNTGTGFFLEDTLGGSSENGLYQNGGSVEIRGGNADFRFNARAGDRSFYNLTAGTLIVGRNILGGSAAGSTNNFDWTGGRFSFDSFNSQFIGQSGGTYGSLVNDGGVLAPGSSNQAGRATLTNAIYVVNSASAALEIEIGGTLQANAGYLTATGYYDYVRSYSTVNLGGVLTIRPMNGFTPATGANFTVLSAPTVSGTFVNALTSGAPVAVTGGPGQYFVTYNSTNVVLTYDAGGVSGAPTVGPVTLNRNYGQPLHVPVSYLLTNSSDAGGGPLTCVWVSATSSNGYPVSLSNNWVYYTPPAGSNTTDYFNFRLANTNGIEAESTATVLVLPPVTNMAAITSVTVTNGGNQFTWSGIPGRTNLVEGATVLGPLPPSDWMTLGSVVVSGLGTATYFETNPPSPRFYRILEIIP